MKVKEGTYLTPRRVQLHEFPYQHTPRSRSRIFLAPQDGPPFQLTLTLLCFFVTVALSAWTTSSFLTFRPIVLPQMLPHARTLRWETHPGVC